MKNNNFRITVSRLAEICNVSPGTVDRALNNRSGISAKTKEKILKVAKEYGFHPSAVSKPKEKIIGIVVFDLFNEYFSELIIQIENICKNHDCSITIMFSDKDKETERKCIENLYFMGVNGIILCPVNDGNEFVQFLNSFNIPIITVGNKIDGIPFSGIDYFKAMCDVTNYVAEKKFSHIVYYSVVLNKYDTNLYAPKELFSGFISTIKKHNIPYVIADTPEKAKYFSAQHKNCAVICTSDYFALQLMNSSYSTSAIIGFDNIYILDKCHIKLDSVARDNVEIAKSAVEFILFGSSDLSYKSYEIIKRGSI